MMRAQLWRRYYNEAVFCLQAKKPLHSGSYEHREPKIKKQGYVRIEIRSAERIFFLRNSRCGAERISVLAKTHGLLRSGFSALTMTRIGAERIIRINLLSRIRTALPEIVTERIGSDIRSWKISRIITERISAF